MPNAQLIYISRPATAMASRDLAQILEISRARNAQVGVTGLLCCAPKLFLQVLEGEPDPVCETFYRILRNPRHTAVRLLQFAHRPQRRFADWDMGFAGMGEIRQAVLDRHSPTGDLEGLVDDPEAARGFIDELAPLLPGGLSLPRDEPA